MWSACQIRYLTTGLAASTTIRWMAAVSLVGEDAREGVADQRLHVRDHGCQRVTVIRIAGQRLHMGNELAALGMADRGCDGDFDARKADEPCPCRCIRLPARAGNRPWARAGAAVARALAAPASASVQTPLRARHRPRSCGRCRG